MKRLPNNAVQKALLLFLKANVTIPVYDYVPEEASLPFITLGAINVQDKSTKVEDMTHVSLQIHIWSHYKGRYEINVLAEKLIHLLTSQQLDLSEDQFWSLSQSVDFYETYPEEDNGYSGILTFEMDIQNIKEE